MPVKSREIHVLSTRIQLPVLRRLLSVMEEQHSTLRWDRGWESMDLTPYQPDDDIHETDWAATARTSSPVIKRHKTTTDLQVMLVIDTGREMGALAPSGESKKKIALTACETIAWLSVAHEDQIDLVAGDAERVHFMPARSGNAHAEIIMRRIGEDITLSSPHSDMSELLARTRTVTRCRSLIVIATDTTRPEPTRLSDNVTRSLSMRHQVVQVSVAGMNLAGIDQDRTVIGVNEGPLPDFLCRDEQLARKAGMVVEQRHAAATHMLNMRGIIQVSVGSSEGVPRALLRALQRSGARR